MNKSQARIKEWKDPEIRKKRIFGISKKHVFNEGFKPWNTGLTKETDERINLTSEKIRNALTQRHKEQGFSEAEKNRGKKISIALTKVKRISKILVYCECGCGVAVVPRRKNGYPRFIYGHNAKGKHWGKHKLSQPCECGCDKITTPGRRFIHGHNYKGTGFEKRQQKGCKLSPEAYEKRIEQVKDGYSNNCKTYHYYSEKNQKQIYYHSKYELACFELLEKMKIVKSYERCPYIVDYEYEGIVHKYIPDIIINYDDGRREIVEIKPEYQLKYERNRLKIEAAEKYFEDKGLLFSVWTETKLFN